MKLKLKLMILLILGLLLWSGCSSILQTNGQSVKEKQQMNKTDSTPTPSAKADSYSTNLDELKEKFNADKGKVRLVTLLSPT